MKKINGILLFALASVFTFSSCMKMESNEQKTEKQGINDYMLLATVYQQNAAETRALCYQAFNAAKLSLDAQLSEFNSDKKPCVVVDIDETMLDNSPFEVKCILDQTNYPVGWDEWINKAEAIVIPGALAFTNYAKEKGVEVFYITNRKQKYLEQTLDNLRKQDFPFADTAHLMLRTTTSDKQARRDKVMENYEILILAGDNLADFDQVFVNRNLADRKDLTDQMKDEFGHRFIVLPNTTYGDWESAIYEGKHDLNPQQKVEKLKSVLKGF